MIIAATAITFGPMLATNSRNSASCGSNFKNSPLGICYTGKYGYFSAQHIDRGNRNDNKTMLEHYARIRTFGALLITTRPPSRIKRFCIIQNGRYACSSGALNSSTPQNCLGADDVLPNLSATPAPLRRSFCASNVSGYGNFN